MSREQITPTKSDKTQNYLYYIGYVYGKDYRHDANVVTLTRIDDQKSIKQLWYRYRYRYRT
jgi:hypothetical protein